MFTGIIQSVGKVLSVQAEKGSQRVRLETGFKDLEPGESVAVNGVCLTVETLPSPGQADFFISPETLARSNLGALKAGGRTNLERALLPTTRLSGHIVQGHVDGLARWGGATQAKDGESHVITVELEEAHARYMIEKGSIALNGVSLTVNTIGKPQGGRTPIAITLVPHTWTNTNFKDLKTGDPVNVEIDVLAKYVEGQLRWRVS